MPPRIRQATAVAAVRSRSMSSEGVRHGNRLATSIDGDEENSRDRACCGRWHPTRSPELRNWTSRVPRPNCPLRASLRRTPAAGTTSSTFRAGNATPDPADFMMENPSRSSSASTRWLMIMSTYLPDARWPYGSLSANFTRSRLTSTRCRNSENGVRSWRAKSGSCHGSTVTRMNVNDDASLPSRQRSVGRFPAITS